MLWKRIASALILIPIAGLAIYSGGFALAGLVLVVGLLADYEYSAMLRSKGHSVSYAWGALLIVAAIVDAQWPDLSLLIWVVTLVPLLALTAQVFRRNAPGSLQGWALTVAGSVYIGIPVSHLLRLRVAPDGLWWVIVAILGTWICDTAAYFVGSTVGSHKFFPDISPKKTWEGAIAGLVCGVGATLLLGSWLLGLSVGMGLLLGTLIVVASTFGDLAESVIKRQVRVKDSGKVIPGHGGMLDRIDSLLFVIPVVHLVAYLFGRF